MSDNLIEEYADECVRDLRRYIETENQLVVDRHDLELKLGAIDYINDHLMYLIGEETGPLVDLNHTIQLGTLKITKFIKDKKLGDIIFVKEQKHNLDKLTSDIEHKDWRAVFGDIKAGIAAEQNMDKVKRDELKALHEQFVDMMREMKKSKIIQALDKDMTLKKDKKDYVKKEEEHYFIEVYKFYRAYERILRHLWRKENHLARELEKDVKKVN